VLGDRGLGEEQGLGRAREAAELGDLQEDFEPAEVQVVQWQPQPPPPQQPPPLGMEEATNPPSLLSPKTESFRVMSLLAQPGQATFVDAPGTYFSNSRPQPRQRYS
jgi:cell division septation protein DedD